VKRRGINWRALLAAASGAVVLLAAAGVATVRARKGKNGPLTSENAGDPAVEEEAAWRDRSTS
jgi:hypothetical protein